MKFMFLFKKMLLLEKICLVQLVEIDGRLSENPRNGLASAEVAATLILSARVKFT